VVEVVDREYMMTDRLDMVDDGMVG
jgi:hypothetical protein